MPFTRPTLTTLIDRIEADIISRLTASVALLRRALLKILARVWAGAMHTFYGYAQYIGEQLILTNEVDTEWLNKHAFMWGITRIAATFADGDVIFTGTDGYDIPSKTVLVRDDGVEFETTTSGTISGGTATINVQALEAGASGNTDAGIILTLSTPLIGIDDEATVDTGLAGGADEESDTDLRERILARIQTPPAGGAAHDYRNESRKVPGVADAFVFGNQNVLTPQLGHVTVVILGISPKVPPSSLLDDVEDALTDPETGIVPVTATLHVEPITEADIKFYISLSPNNSDTQAAVTQNLQDLLDLEGSPGGTILLSHIRDAIATAAGVNDYEITDIEVETVSIGVVNIVLTDFDYPILDTPVYASL